MGIHVSSDLERLIEYTATTIELADKDTAEALGCGIEQLNSQEARSVLNDLQSVATNKCFKLRLAEVDLLVGKLRGMAASLPNLVFRCPVIFTRKFEGLFLFG